MRPKLLFSMLAGVTSLALGLGATLALLSFLVGRPTGPEFLFERFSADVPKYGSMGGVGGSFHFEKRIPSMKLVGILVVGASAGGLGIALSRNTKACPCARVAKGGVLSNVVGILVWWLGMLLNDFTPYS
jgi:hypothetical protein